MNNTLILCDLGGTLIDSNNLNSYSYIAAIKQSSFDVPSELNDIKRITETEIRNAMPSLSEDDIIENIDMLKVNTKLLAEITNSEAIFCICTASVMERAESECRLLGIYCDMIISSDKTKIELEKIVSKLTEKFHKFEKIVCYDDNENVLRAAEECGFEAVPVKFEV